MKQTIAIIASAAVFSTIGLVAAHLSHYDHVMVAILGAFIGLAIGVFAARFIEKK